MITSRGPRRIAALIAVGAAAAMAWLAPTTSASAAGRADLVSAPQPYAPMPDRMSLVQETLAGPAPERAAAAAIDDITAPPGTADPLAHIPADFPRMFGYRPELARLANGDEIAIDPNGGCSVLGGGKPFDLATVCMAHDLGYDLLRYARRHGDPLGPDARIRVDDRFAENLLTQCGSRYEGAEIAACDAMAKTFDAGVGFNSWRQDYGPPFAAAGMNRTVAVFAVAVLLLYFATRAATLRIVRRIRPVKATLARSLPGEPRLT